MKTSIKQFIVAASLIIGLLATTNTSHAQASASVSFSVFHDNLQAYGRWVNNPHYGQVWISNESGFVPYKTGGHWVYTDYGWTWVSDYSWGWAPFHYGRWDYDASYGGWFWVPGYDWGPAWVSWRSSGDYYGWAPLTPGISVSVGVSFGASIAAERWCFVPHQYISSPGVKNYYVNNSRNVTIIKNTTIINNTTVNNNVHYTAGPKRTEVERVNHTQIHTYAVNNSSKPGATVINKNTVNIYRPVVNKTTVVNNNNKTVVNNNNKTNIHNNNHNTTVQNNAHTQNNKEVVHNQPAANQPNNNHTQPQHNDVAKKPAQPQQHKEVTHTNPPPQQHQQAQPKPQQPQHSDVVHNHPAPQPHTQPQQHAQPPKPQPHPDVAKSNPTKKPEGDHK